ncbi:HVO_A0114 family putative DNA-binding protein [Natronolimnohabitans innermongolicus]
MEPVVWRSSRPSARSQRHATDLPESSRELARLVDRHPPKVSQNVAELADYGLQSIEHGQYSGGKCAATVTIPGNCVTT